MVMNDEKNHNAVRLLLDSSIVSEEVKGLLTDKIFLSQNNDILIDLAKLVFIADSIDIENDQIIARKSVITKKEPNIPIDDVLYRYLLKIKHDTLTDSDILKLKELQKYRSYLKLYQLLNLAMDQKTKIKKINNNASLKMSLTELEEFLNND